MPSNPLPVSLQQECYKAQRIYSQFVDPINGLDALIPPSVLRRAKGFCFMSVAKAGFVFSARAGSGLVIARLPGPDGGWSAPSAVGTAGGGFGLQVGVEVAEFLIILNSRAAVRSFMAKGSITLGGNMSIAAGPLGRNVEGNGTLSSKGRVAAMYSYSKSKGLFGGASVEGSLIVERSDANAKAYGHNVTATQLLSGAVDPPSFALPLIETITRLSAPRSSIPGWIDDAPGGDSYDNLPIDGESDDEDDYFGRGAGGAGAGRRRAESDGLTPREYSARGYAFGSSFAAGGSGSSPSGAGGGGGEPLPSPSLLAAEKSRIGAMLGSVGRSRSGSGGSKKGRAGGVGEDPFASTSSFGAGGEEGWGTGTPSSAGAAGGGGARPGGPAYGAGEARFETHFSRLSDSEDGEPAPVPAPRRSPSASKTASPARSRANSSAAKRGELDNSFGFGYFSTPASATSSLNGATSPGGGGKTKLTKPRSGSGASAGLRARAEGMSWGENGEGAGAGGSRFKARFRSSSSAASEGPVSAFDPDALNSCSPSASPAKPKSRLRASTVPSKTRSPFDDGEGAFNASNSSLSSFEQPSGGNRALSKPWDSEDESYFTSPAPPPSSSHASSHPPSSAPRASNNPAAATPVSPGAGRHAALDLREVEADFASAMDLARNGGEAEVGSYSLGPGRDGAATSRSRSSTVTGGRSRSGTVTTPGAGQGGAGSRPLGVGKDGIGWAVALFDFPGVEPTDLPFLKSDVLTLLARDDDEWWTARKGVRVGMVPRNYLEAHFE
ncbi:hypothetical protein JCM10207_000320 [Rhodosporidiobolus poonsookiae]